MDGEQCGNCRFWGAFGASESFGEYGQCRRHPPQIITAPILDYEGGDEVPVSIEGRFPQTDFECWCGEWQPLRSGELLRELCPACGIPILEDDAKEYKGNHYHKACNPHGDE